jgi:DNA-binding transcriptional LysR family regulator
MTAPRSADARSTVSYGKCEVDELEAIVKLVANRVGVALLPQTAAQRRWPAAVRVVDLGPHTFHRDIGLVHRSQASLSAPARMLVALMVKHEKLGVTPAA